MPELNNPVGVSFSFGSSHVVVGIDESTFRVDIPPMFPSSALRPPVREAFEELLQDVITGTISQVSKIRRQVS